MLDLFIFLLEMVAVFLLQYAFFQNTVLKLESLGQPVLEYGLFFSGYADSAQVSVLMGYELYREDIFCHHLAQSTQCTETVQ